MTMETFEVVFKTRRAVMLWIWAHGLEVMGPMACQVSVTGHRLSRVFILEGRQT